MSQNPNIPGYNVRVGDGNLIAARTAPSTRNVAILDVGLWGPINEAVTVDNLEDGVAVFGKYTGAFGDTTYVSGFNGNGVIRGLKQAVESGCRNITVVRGDFGGVAASTIVYFKHITGTPASEGVALTAGKVVLTFSALPSGLVVGNAAWISATPGTKYWITAINTTAKTVTVGKSTAFGSLPTGNAGEWTFSKSYTIEAAYPGVVGGLIKFKTEDVTPVGGETDIYRMSIMAPTELGGRTARVSSTRAATMRDLAFAINSSLPTLVKMSLGHGATGLEAFNTSDLLSVSGDNDNPDGWLNIGTAYVSTDATLDIVAGTNWKNDEVSGDAMNPYGQTVTAVQRVKWYAEMLGSCLNADHEDRTLPLMRGIDVGIIVLPNLFLDDMVDATTGEKIATPYNLDTSGTWSEETYANVDADNPFQWLVDFVHMQRQEGILSSVVFGISPLADTTRRGVRARKDFLQLVAFADGTIENLDDSEDVVDAGGYFDVFAGPQRIVIDRETGYYLASGAVQYAALRSTIPASQTTSQVPFPTGTLPLYEFITSEVNALAGGQGVNSDGGAYVVCDTRKTPDIINMDVTFAARASDFKIRHNMDVCDVAIEAARAATGSFLGQPFGLTERMAMDTALTSELDRLVDLKILFGGKDVGWKYYITDTPTDGQLNSILIELQVKPKPELDWINLNVNLFN